MLFLQIDSLNFQIYYSSQSTLQLKTHKMSENHKESIPEALSVPVVTEQQPRTPEKPSIQAAQSQQVQGVHKEGVQKQGTPVAKKAQESSPERSEMQPEQNSPQGDSSQADENKNDIQAEQESEDEDNSKKQPSDSENDEQKSSDENGSEKQNEEGDQEDESNPDQVEDDSSNIKSDSKEEENKSSDDNETKKQQPANGKKCFNKLCNKKNLYKKVRSKVEHAKYRFLCKSCYENYIANSFCQFCEQIYSNNGNEEDDDRWIGCDMCDRWNHIECQKKYRNQNINDIQDSDSLYRCLTCSQKAVGPTRKNAAKKHDANHNSHADEGARNGPGGKQKFEISKDQRIPIFNKKIQNLPSLEYFLQTYNFRLWINDNLIREDMETLRAAQKKLNQEEFKKNKKVKTD